MRKPRRGEHVCRCPAYRFPHRFGGGRCTGVSVADEYWSMHWGGGECRTCVLNDDGVCQVLSGTERANECVVFQDFVHVNEIILLGKNK
jgi:hypothetical protein